MCKLDTPTYNRNCLVLAVSCHIISVFVEHMICRIVVAKDHLSYSVKFVIVFQWLGVVVDYSSMPLYIFHLRDPI